MIGEVAVAEYQAGRFRKVKEPVGVQVRDPDTRGGRAPHHRRGVAARREFQQHVQPRRDPADAGLGQVLGEGRGDAVPAGAVPGAGGAQVAVIGAGLHERGEGQLVEDRRPGGPHRAARTSGAHDRGVVIQPMPTAGESVLVTEPISGHLSPLTGPGQRASVAMYPGMTTVTAPPANTGRSVSRHQSRASAAPQAPRAMASSTLTSLSM